jgi:hypothetical protein
MAYTSIVKYAPMSLVEMPEFTERVEELLSEEQCYELLTHIAQNPECGDVMPGTGGVRKLRWALRGKGKRGGARVIYYYHDQHMPILLITMYPKSAKRDLNQAEKNELRKLMPVLVRTYKSRRSGER